MDFRPVEQNLRESFRILASVREVGEVREAPGVTIASLGASFQMFNAAFFSAPVQDEFDLAHRIATASAYFQARGLEWSFWACEGWLDSGVRRRAQKVFHRAGLSLASELPGMIGERLSPAPRPLPEIELRPVMSESVLRSFREIGALCFHVPPPWFAEVFDAETPRRDRFAAYVAYHFGVPVGTAATVIAADVIGVYNVATLPEYRHQGLAESIMRSVLERTREQSGIERSILQSTAQGLRLYQRMGYRTVTKVDVYTS
jgi:GNAT superfamily N-acetyltransferase